MRPYSTDKSEAVCRSALARGVLTAVRPRTGLAWKFGRRSFCAVTVARIIAAGDAIRIGDVVVAA